MLPVITLARFRQAASASVEKRTAAALVIISAIHLSALALMLWSETELVSMVAYALTWGFLNFCWLFVLKRPSLAAALSLAMFVVIVLLSRFKHDAFLLTANFIDVMFIDDDTVKFLLAIFPQLTLMLIVALLIGIPAAIYAWRVDCYRVRRRIAAPAAALCLSGLAGIAYAVPVEQYKEFMNDSYISKFARFGSVTLGEYFTRGLFESDADVAERLKIGADDCRLPRRAPHILMILDESSFNITQVKGIKVPQDYQNHFKSFDGKLRTFLVEGAGGPTWYTEYNVLTGLSVRSYGRFADSVTRIAAGRVERGLPYALRRCGYRTASVYPWRGNFLGARSFHQSTGIETFYDAKDLGTLEVQPDHFYFDAALKAFREQRGKGPTFVFAYTMANHMPYTFRYRPELAPEWKDPGNASEVDEYLRRQMLSDRDYKQLLTRLRTEFPGEPFLVIRFGDHQPYFGKHLIDASLDDGGIGRNVADFDTRYYTTYYAIDGVNFTPHNLTSAINNLDAPFLPIVVMEAAGVPLDPSFAEQKKVFLRCDGRFYSCKEGAETRRFNRLLIEAGLIRGM